MTQDEIIEMARDSGMELYGLGKNRARFVHHLVAFANLVAAKKREALAQTQEPVAWRNAAIRVGEDLSSVGSDGYYDMTAQQWLDWALSVVTVHAPPPQRTWVGLTDEQIDACWNKDLWKEKQPHHIFAKAIESKIKELNT